ncbi:MAG TPA: hypothetical protein VGD53_04665 [Actinoallomurus sp.]|jgi:hypothetical protein
MADNDGTARTENSVAQGAAAEPELLGIYLNDHLAGATMGTELIHRITAAHRESDDSAVLERLAEEITEDRAGLIEIMGVLGVPVRQYKIALGWVAEKAARLKPNGKLLERSPLSSLEELEIMRLGVEGKRAGWKTLLAVAEHDDRLERARLEELIARAERQSDTLEELRMRVSITFARAL